MKPHAIPSLSIASLLLASLVLSLAAPCPAQTRKTPEQELAAVIAVEEQQGDLAKAEALYRQAVSDASLSPAAQQLARQRLARLLQRLGREAKELPLVTTGEQVVAAEAQPAKEPQDPARIAEMRRKAGELLDLHTGGSRLSDIECRGLEWMGEPIVPEILARGLNSQRVGLLWRIGGLQVREYLLKAASDPATPTWLVQEAWQLRRPELMEVAEAFLAHPNLEVVNRLLFGGNANVLIRRVSVDALLSMAERGDAPRRALVITHLHDRITRPAEANRMVALLRQALASTDPTLGAVAQQALHAGYSYLYICVAGLELLAAQQGPDPVAWGANGRLPLDAYGADNRLLPEAVARLWSAMLSCAQRNQQNESRASCACSWLELLATEGNTGKVSELLPLASAGQPVWDAVAERMQRDDIKSVLETIRAFPESERTVHPQVLRQCLRLGVPPEALMQLLALAPSPKQLIAWRNSDDKNIWLWVDLLTSTGHAAAWNILLATHELALTQPTISNSIIVSLLRLAQQQPSEERRMALRKIAMDLSQRNMQNGYVLLCLLHLGDEPALDMITSREAAVENVLAPDGKRQNYTPLEYLFASSAVPPAHRYSEARLTELLQRLKSQPVGLSGLSPHQVAADASDDHVRLLAMQVPNAYSSSTGPDKSLTWCGVALERARSQNGQNGWAEWLEAALETPLQRWYLLQAMTKEELQARLPQLRRWAEGGSNAGGALDALERAGAPVDLAAALANPDATVNSWAFHRVVRGKAEVPVVAMTPFLANKSTQIRREAAQFFGKHLATEAVPGLIALLRDDEPAVREAAEQALTRIRFYHEQQAHWDRVLLGLDASPASAMEKLLLQARPAAPQAQRLLAIPSLGSLGKAEALPFLIEWSNENDTEIAAAAKAAIIRIHLEPRR